MTNNNMLPENIIISVIVPTFNRSIQLKKCIDSLMTQSYNKNKFEIIIINDGSTDNTINFLESIKTIPNISIINQDNKGPASARNQGLKKSKGDYIAFIDDDCIASRDWLLELTSSLPQDPKIAGIGGKIHGLSNTIIDKFIENDIYLFKHQINRTNTDYIVTANSLFKKEALMRINGFNENFMIAGGEDNYLSYQLIKKGYTIIKTEKAIIYHHHPNSIISFYKTSYKYGIGEKIGESLGNKFQFMKDLTLYKLIIKKPELINEKRKIKRSDRLYFIILNLIKNIAFYRGYHSYRPKKNF